MGVPALALLAASLVAAAPPIGAAAGTCEDMPPGLGARLLEVPTDLADEPRAQSRIIDAVEPGATVQRHVRFSNGEADGPLRLRIDALPATIESGDFLIDRQDADGELARWTALDAERVTLGPCEHVDVLVTIRVPGDATGRERYGAITAEHIGEAGAGIRVASRIGIRVYLHVLGAAPATSDLDIVELVPRRLDDDRPVIDVELANTGNRALDLRGHVELTNGPGGLRAGPVDTEGTVTLGPGERGTSRALFGEEVPNGPWRARVVMSSGSLERQAEAEITFPDHGVGETAQAHPLRDRDVLVPLATGLLLTMTLLLWLMAWRRRRCGAEEEGGLPASPEIPVPSPREPSAAR